MIRHLLVGGLSSEGQSTLTWRAGRIPSNDCSLCRVTVGHRSACRGALSGALHLPTEARHPCRGWRLASPSASVDSCCRDDKGRHFHSANRGDIFTVLRQKRKTH